MTHWELANCVTDYLDDALDAAQRLQANAHLASCEECRALVEEVRFAMATCAKAEDLEPAPWLVPRILRSTVGERQPAVTGRLAAWLRRVLRPQVAYSVSMAIFSLSFILYAANVNLRGLKFRELNPASWAYRANSRGHLLVARAEKYYYDLRFVYEVQSVLREVRQQPSSQRPAAQTPQAPGGGSSSAASPAEGQLALERAP